MGRDLEGDETWTLDGWLVWIGDQGEWSSPMTIKERIEEVEGRQIDNDIAQIIWLRDVRIDHFVDYLRVHWDKVTLDKTHRVLEFRREQSDVVFNRDRDPSVALLVRVSDVESRPQIDIVSDVLLSSTPDLLREKEHHAVTCHKMGLWRCYALALERIHGAPELDGSDAALEAAQLRCQLEDEDLI